MGKEHGVTPADPPRREDQVEPTGGGVAQETPVMWAQLPARADTRVHAWLQANTPADPQAIDLVEGVRSEQHGLGFTKRLLELIADSDDAFISALGLRRLSQDLPDTMPKRDRLAIRAGGIAALGLPWAVIPLARRWLRDRLAHLACVATLPSDAQKPGELEHLHEALAAIHNRGATAAIALDGAAVTGPRGVVRERTRLRALSEMPEVSHLGVDPARLTYGTAWGLEERTRFLTKELTDLALHAADHDCSITLDVTAYRDQRFAVNAMLAVLDDPSCDQAQLGVTLAAEIPEAVELLTRLLVQTAARERRGARPLEIRLTCASTLNRETVASLTSGLAIPVLPSRTDREAAFLQLLTRCFDGHGVRPVLASDSPYLIAAALELAHDLSPSEALVVEVRSGVSDELSRALVAEQVATRIHLPLVSPAEFGALVPRIIDIAAEAADSDSALARQHMLDTEYLSSPEHRYEEKAHLEEVCRLAATPPAVPHRTQDRAREWDPSERDSALFYRPPDDPNTQHTGGLTAAVLSLSRNDDTGELEVTQAAEPRVIPPVSDSGFANEPVTDPTRVENRQWLSRQLAAAARLRDATGRDEATERDEVTEPRDAAKPHDEATELSDAAKPHDEPTADSLPDSLADARRALAGAVEAAGHWTTTPHRSRGRLLRRIALTSVAARDRFTQAFAAACGAPADSIDHSVNTVIDSGRYLAQLAESLDQVRGATFHPDRVALLAVTTPQFAATALHTALGVLAAGSTVVLTVPRTLTPLLIVATQEWTTAGLPEGVVQWVACDDVMAVTCELAREPGVDRALVLGERDCAHQVVRARPDLRVNAFGSGVGTALITPSAHFETAARDAVRSAFTGPDRALRGVHALLLLGTAYRSERLRELLADTVRAIHVGDTVTPAGGNSESADPTADPDAATADPDPIDFPTSALETGPIGLARITASDPDFDEVLAATAPADPPPSDITAAVPQSLLDRGVPTATHDALALTLEPLPQPPSERGLRALTQLEAGESWLIAPQQLDEAGLVWRPGIKLGVAKDSPFWRDCVGLPVLGVVHVHSIADAIATQAAIGGGSVASLHSWDTTEIRPWLDQTRAASLTVNRPTTDALIERLPSGSWSRAGMGVTPLLGGPHQLVTLGSWRVRPGTRSSTLHLRGLEPEVQHLIELAQAELGYEEFDMVRRAALADALTWRTDLGVARDAIGLDVERNLLRYWPVATHIRAAEDAALDEVLRVVAAGLLVRAPLEISSGVGLPAAVLEFLRGQGVQVTVEREEDWFDRIAGEGARVGSAPAERVRLIGGDRVRVAEWLGGLDRTALWAEPVTMAGPVELLSLLREQSVSIRAHRYGMAALPSGLGDWLRSIGR